MLDNLDCISQDEIRPEAKVPHFQKRIDALKKILAGDKHLPHVTGLNACLMYGAPVMPLRDKKPLFLWNDLAHAPSFAKSYALMSRKDPEAIKKAKSEKEKKDLPPALYSGYAMIMGAPIADYEMLNIKEPVYNACFDFDSGEQAERFRKTLAQERPELLDTFMQQTSIKENGKSGLHYVFACKRLLKTKSLPLFDLKAYKGYIQGPGSRGKDEHAYHRLNEHTFRILNEEEVEYLRQTVSNIVGHKLVLENAKPKHVPQAAFKLVKNVWIKNVHGKDGGKKPKGKIFKASRSDFDMSLCQTLYNCGFETAQELAEAYGPKYRLNVPKEYSQALSSPKQTEVFERMLTKCKDGRADEVLKAVCHELLQASEERTDYKSKRTDKLIYQALIKTLEKNRTNKIRLTGNRLAKQVSMSSKGAANGIDRLEEQGLIEAYKRKDGRPSSLYKIVIPKSLTDKIITDLKIEDGKTLNYIRKSLQPKEGVVTDFINAEKQRYVCIEVSFDNPSLAIGVGGKTLNHVLTFVENNEFEQISTKKMTELLELSSRVTARKYLRALETVGMVKSEEIMICGNKSEVWSKTNKKDLIGLEALFQKQGRNWKNVLQETLNFAGGKIEYLADRLFQVEECFEFISKFASALFELLALIATPFVYRERMDREGLTEREWQSERRAKHRRRAKGFGERKSQLDYVVDFA